MILTVWENSWVSAIHHQAMERWILHRFFTTVSTPWWVEIRTLSRAVSNRCTPIWWFVHSRACNLQVA
jgi:hypothetical protein